MPSPSSFLSALRAFSSSPSSLRVLQSLTGPGSVVRAPASTQTLYILDSSFNPPTLAHLRICLSALQSDEHRRPGGYRLLLLLAIQNADKAPKPAGFEQRLCMMQLLAEELRSRVSEDGAREDDCVSVDVGVCKLPLFVDKIRAVTEASEYHDEAMQQVHLIGYDTLMRLMDPKYYPPSHNLEPLSILFEKHRLRVTKRTDEAADDKDQAHYLTSFAQGHLEEKGANRQWAAKVDLVEGRKVGEQPISSTKVRDAVKGQDWQSLRALVPRSIAEWIQTHSLYAESD